MKTRIWMWLAVAGIMFFIIVLFNGGEAPWNSKVLFDCPPIGDGGYVQLNPHEVHPDCEYFGPPVSR